MEYGYIALAMGNMLKDTNKNIKNMEINETSGIVIDANWWCIAEIVFEIAAIVGLVGSTIVIIWAIIFSDGLASPLGYLIAAIISIIGSSISVIRNCF